MTDHDFLFKVVVIGDAGVGKSTFVNKISTDSNVQYKSRTIKVDDIVIKGQIWDSGNDRFKAYHGAVGALVIYSVTSRASFKNCETWLNEIKSNAQPGAVITLVGNKSDMNDSREVPEDEAKTFALKNNLSFIEVSAILDHGVGEAVDRLLMEIFKQQTSQPSPQPQQQQQPPTYYPRNQTPSYPPSSVPPIHDPLRIPPPVRPGPGFGIGSGDLYPSPGAGFGYIPGLDPFGGGSLIGPHHPGFGIRDPFAPNPAHFPSGRGSLPPRGARFDPFGPPGVRPYPDSDHFPPPGNFDDDMYM